MKTCTKCGIEKDESEFGKSGKNKDGSIKFRADCKECQCKYVTDRRLLPEIQKRDNEYRVQHKKEMAAYYQNSKEERRKYYKDNIKQQKNSQLLRHYGITLEQYNQMFEAQNGVCAICGQPEILFNKSLAVDHDHKTGKIRALLCGNCNHALGKFKDSQEILQSAINYLKSHS